MPSVSSRGGDLVLIYNAPEGHVIHYLMGSFGRRTGGVISMKFKLPDHLNRLIVFNEYPDPTFGGSFEPADKVILVNKWDKVLELLEDGRIRSAGRRSRSIPALKSSTAPRAPFRDIISLPELFLAAGGRWKAVLARIQIL